MSFSSFKRISSFGRIREGPGIYREKDNVLFVLDTILMPI